MKHLLLATVFMLSAFTAFGMNHVQKRQRALQVLQQAQINLAQLQKSGHQVLLGELTGAGKRVPLKQVQMLIHKNDIIQRHEIKNVRIKPESKNSLADLQSFTVRERINGHVVDTQIHAHELVGAIAK